VHDADLASRLVICAWRDAYKGCLPPSLLASLRDSPHHDRRSWERRILEPDATTWFISDQAGTEVGVLRIRMGTSSVPDTDGELTTLYLLAHARGHGLGSAALVYVRAAASRQGARALGLGVLAGNERGQQFYERHGAYRIGERIAFQWEGNSIVEVLYRFC
jgi:ribosomal protein S18 acetylase RimI-like enzyme